MDKSQIKSLKILFTALTSALEIARLSQEQESENQREMRSLHHQILEELKGENPRKDVVNILFAKCELLAEKIQAELVLESAQNFENGGVNFKKSDE